MTEKNKTADAAKKGTKKNAAEPAKGAKKASKKNAAALNTESKTSAKKRAVGVARLSGEQVNAKREDAKKIMTGGGSFGPAELKEKLGVNTGQLRRVLADDAFEKIGTVGPGVKYKLAG